jgi:hypothetical protein
MPVKRGGRGSRRKAAGEPSVLWPATARWPRRLERPTPPRRTLARDCVTMSLMKEKPVSTKYTKTPRREATAGDGKKKDTEPRRETRKRIRKIVERHRETFDDLAK